MAQNIYSIPELVKVMDPLDLHTADPSALIDTLAYDSRKIRQAARSLFFALQGVRDGHDFIAAAYEKGVRNFVVSRAVHYPDFPDANFLHVRDCLRALQRLAAYHRSQFDYPVLAITGSNGKTIVKDWLFQLLSPEYRIIRSPKSFNSHLGVALSLWQMEEGYDLALIEAGISRAGEMKHLAEMIRPDLGVMTNLGMAHQEGFRDADEKEQEKALLLQDVKQAVYPQDPRVQVEKIETLTDDEGSRGTRISARVEGGQVAEIHIPFTDRASIDNAVTCWAVMRMLNYDQETIAQRMPHLQVMEMRLELKQGLDRSTLIDDSYSNDLSSLTISLDLLSQQRQHGRKTLILSDLPELGTEEAPIYEQVRRLLESHHLDQLITVGPALAAHQGTFPVREHLVFYSTEDLLLALPSLDLSDRSILIKGARHYAFERISARLTARTHETIMEIDMSALAHNVQAYQAHIGPSVGLMVMVKAFAYGVGSPEVAALLQFQGVDYLAVAFADEGVALRRHGITLPILVMSADVSSFDSMIRYDLEPEVYSFSSLQAWLDHLRSRELKRPLPIHLKFDTGMHRLGFRPEEVENIAAILADQDQLKVVSAFSHFAASGDRQQDAYTALQLERFETLTGQLEKRLGYSFTRHIANTDAILRHPKAHLDLVRLGLGLYGMDPKSALQVRPAIQLKTTVAQVHHLPKGETIGYGRVGVLERDSRIATVKIGYADGYDRRLGRGVGQMQIGGQLAPTMGDICMDLCMLDVTDLPEVIEGEEVLVFPDLYGVAARIGTIPYELVVNISQRVKRLYYY